MLLIFSSAKQKMPTPTSYTMLATSFVVWSVAAAQPSIQGDGQDIVLTPGAGGRVLME
jgi:hypothetical protein